MPRAGPPPRPRRQRLALCALFALAALAAAGPAGAGPPPHPRPHDMDHSRFAYFAVALQPGASPSQLAASMGMELVGDLAPLDDHFLLRADRHPHAPTAHMLHKRLLRRMDEHPDVEYASLQTPGRRLFSRAPYSKEQLDKIWRDQLGIRDPGVGRQWHLYNSGIPGNDLNVTGAWLQGVTGENATVCIIDDGLDYTHPDLKDAFVLEGSWDFNGPNKSAWPKPQMAEDRHGTRCAGEVAARRNDKCGVGVAYNARVSGVRILSADITEVDEAASITYGYQINQVYSCSWGPADDGRTIDGPPPLVARAFREGIERGRGGLGSIYVFATGNGGGSGDNCNFDGYTNSLYTITVGAIDSNNNHPMYSEQCSAQLAVTYSSGGPAGIYTCDVMPYECTQYHGGTSAAAPLAAGVMALVLSLRPDLHWRDLQRLTMESARPDIGAGDADWADTHAGRRYNHKYGYGRIDTNDIVANARDFKSLGAHTWFQTHYIVVKEPIPQGNDGTKSVFTFTKEMKDQISLYRLEHVTVTVGALHTRRGDLEVHLISPHGMVSVLAAARPYDTSKEGFRNWTFMTVKHWDEDPVGDWTLNVLDRSNPNENGTFYGWAMRLWGEAPEGVVPKQVPMPPIRTATVPGTSVIAPATSAAAMTTSAPAPTTTTTTPPPPATTPPPPPPATTDAISSTASGSPTPPPAPATPAPSTTSSAASPAASTALGSNSTVTGETPAGDDKSSAGLWALVTVAVFVGLAGLAVFYLRRRLLRPKEPDMYQFQQLPELEDDEIDGFLDDVGDEEVELEEVDVEMGKANGAGENGTKG
ncbi:subtilase [Hyaloraphidium curvatum]|nr:subtilase [Hyaloraphidium curvatum]